MEEIQIRIQGDCLRYIYNDHLLNFAKLGKTVTTRASHVEPSENGWMIDLSPVGGPILGPYLRRKDALAAEVEWLKSHQIPVPGEHHG